MIDNLKYISLDTIDVSSLELVKERISRYQDQDHSRWIFKKDKLYYKIWNETYIRKNNIISGILSGFYDNSTCPALYGIIVWEGQCRGYIMHECDDYDILNVEFFDKIKHKTSKTEYFIYDFCEKHVKKYKEQYCLIDLEGVYHLDYYEQKNSEQKDLGIPGEFIANSEYKNFIESLLYTPLSEEEFLNMELQQGRGGKEIILQNYTLSTVKDVVEFFSDTKNNSDVKESLIPENWQYYNCMIAEFRHNVGDHHELGWGNMTEEYYSNLHPMSDNEIKKFLRDNPVPFFGDLIKHGYHRACSMIGRLIKGKKYIPFYIKKDRFYKTSPINYINYIRDLDKLGIPRNEYSISNSAILSLMGVNDRINNNGDLDIVISSKLRSFLHKTGIKLPDTIHPFDRDSGKFKKFGCENDDDLVYNYSVKILGFNFTEPRFYFNRMHKVMRSAHRSIEENYKIKESGKVGAENFNNNEYYKKYPFSRVEYDKWGFNLIKELQIL